MRTLTGLHTQFWALLAKAVVVMICIKALAGMATGEPMAKHPRAAGRVFEVPARKLSVSMKLVIGPSRIAINEVHVSRNQVIVVYNLRGEIVRRPYRPTQRVQVIRRA
jgi:hypothetical protein